MHSIDRTRRFARFALVHLVLLALTIPPIHTHQLLTNQSLTGSFERAHAATFCFECTFGGDHAIVSPGTKVPVLLGSSTGAIELTATVASIVLPELCGRAPPAA